MCFQKFLKLPSSLRDFGNFSNSIICSSHWNSVILPSILLTSNCKWIPSKFRVNIKLILSYWNYPRRYATWAFQQLLKTSMIFMNSYFYSPPCHYLHKCLLQITSSFISTRTVKIKWKIRKTGWLVLRFTIQSELNLILKRVFLKSACTRFSPLALLTSCKISKGTFVWSDSLKLF